MVRKSSQSSDAPAPKPERYSFACVWFNGKSNEQISKVLSGPDAVVEAVKDVLSKGSNHAMSIAWLSPAIADMQPGQ